MTQFRLHSGIVTGRDHFLAGENRQDALRVKHHDEDGKEFIVAVVSDGCGEGKYSEVGAHFTAETTLRKMDVVIDDIVASNFGTLETAAKSAYQYLFGGFRQILSVFSRWESPPSEMEIIRDHLLATVMGVVVTQTEGMIFYQGDGIYVIDDDVTVIDQDNYPLYPAYHLVDRQYLVGSASSIPKQFTVVAFDPKQVNRVAIATDGWKEDIALLPEVWGITHPAGLQRKMNVWSRQKHFSDDASIVVVEWDTQGE